MSDQKTDKERIASLEADNENRKRKEESFVTKDQFLPVKLIAYGLAAIVMSSVLIAIIGKVLVNGH